MKISHLRSTSHIALLAGLAGMAAASIASPGAMALSALGSQAKPPPYNVGYLASRVRDLVASRASVIHPKDDKGEGGETTESLGLTLTGTWPTGGGDTIWRAQGIYKGISQGHYSFSADPKQWVGIFHDPPATSSSYVQVRGGCKFPVGVTVVFLTDAKGVLKRASLTLTNPTGASPSLGSFGPKGAFRVILVAPTGDGYRIEPGTGPDGPGKPSDDTPVGIGALKSRSGSGKPGNVGLMAATSVSGGVKTSVFGSVIPIRTGDGPDVETSRIWGDGCTGPKRPPVDGSGFAKPSAKEEELWASPGEDTVPLARGLNAAPLIRTVVFSSEGAGAPGEAGGSRPGLGGSRRSPGAGGNSPKPGDFLKGLLPSGWSMPTEGGVPDPPGIWVDIIDPDAKGLVTLSSPATPYWESVPRELIALALKASGCETMTAAASSPDKSRKFFASIFTQMGAKPEGELEITALQTVPTHTTSGGAGGGARAQKQEIPPVITHTTSGSGGGRILPPIVEIPTDGSFMSRIGMPARVHLLGIGKDGEPKKGGESGTSGRRTGTGRRRGPIGGGPPDPDKPVGSSNPAQHGIVRHVSLMLVPISQARAILGCSHWESPIPGPKYPPDDTGWDYLSPAGGRDGHILLMVVPGDPGAPDGLPPVDPPTCPPMWPTTVIVRDPETGPYPTWMPLAYVGQLGLADFGRDAPALCHPVQSGPRKPGMLVFQKR